MHDINEAYDMVIFGGLGDLSRRKLIPAMYRAMREGDMPEGSRLILCSRSEIEQLELEKQVLKSLYNTLKSHEINDDDFAKFCAMVRPAQLDLMDHKKGWTEFTDLMNEYDRVRVYYLAVIPSAYGPSCKNLSKAKLITEQSRLVVEKPIGYDLPSAEAINETMAKYFEESQIYRIDHYLGKETVQNLLTLRFSNFLFEGLWDNKSIDHIQISISEKVGLEGRAGFYDDVGALRDMVQNHLLQLLCLMALDSPNELCSDSIRQEKVKVLKALKPIVGDDVDENTIRGQYVSGKVDGEKVEGYLDELENYDSKTETFVAIKAEVNSWRWAGVPFYLRTGKRLDKRMAQIVVQFKDVTHNLYQSSGQTLIPNQLLIMLQPEEHIEIRLMANDVGGGTNTIEPKILNLDFDSDESVPIRTAYQRLIMDAVRGDSTLFIHRDEVTAAWKWIDPIVEHWNETNKAPQLYTPGSWGPDACKDIFEKPSQYWHNPGEQ